jgi:hypothetical protein
MKKPEKKQTSYVTLDEGTDFRKIARIMSESGYQMNHATARNVLMMSLSNLFKHVSTEMSSELSDSQVNGILRDQSIHEALSDILFEAYQELKQENNQDVKF